MEFKIDVTKIDNSPIENIKVSNHPEFKKLKNEILFSNPTTYLISGYRGAGKTSYIKSLVNEIRGEMKNTGYKERGKNEKVFIHLNIGKYTSFSNVLRNLIREIYFSLSNDDQILKKIQSNNPKLYEKIELIFARTFHEVDFNNFYSTSKDKTVGFNWNTASMTSLFKLSTLFLGAFNLFDYFTNKEMLIWGIPLFVTSLFFLLFSEVKLINTSSEKEEMLKKTLYDDEIAEYYLIDIIKELKENNFELVVIIDELDKLDNESNITDFVSEIKPLMLSGQINFILIFGQKMLYKYLMSDLKNDNLLSSLFTRSIHVPLLNKTGFESYFKELVEETDYKNPILLKYLNANILASGRVFRKFISLIRNDIVYDTNGIAYLNINENDDILSTNSKISNIIFAVEQEWLIDNKEIPEGSKDYIVTYLYLVINRMKRMKLIEFNLDNILINNEIQTDDFSTFHFEDIKSNTQLLLSRMVEEKLLDISDNHEMSDGPTYTWRKDVKLEKDFNQIDQATKYLELFTPFENLIRELTEHLNNYFGRPELDKSMKLEEFIEYCYENKLITDKHRHDFGYYDNLRDEIAHGVIKEEVYVSTPYENPIYGFSKLKNDIFEYIMHNITSFVNKNSMNKSQVGKKPMNIVNDVMFEFMLSRNFPTKGRIDGKINKIVNIMERSTGLSDVRILIYTEEVSDTKRRERKLEEFFSEKGIKNVKIKVVNTTNLSSVFEYLKV